MLYEIDVYDWWQFENTGIPDTAWQSHGPGNVYQSTIIEITDFDWAIKFRETRPEYLQIVKEKNSNEQMDLEQSHGS